MENGGPTKFSQLSNSKVTDKEDTSRHTLYSNESNSVQGAPTVEQNNSVTSLDLQENEKSVNDAPVENIVNLNNSLVSSEKQDVISDSAPTTDKLNIECSEIEQKNNEANIVDIHSNLSDVYDDENMYDTVASNEVKTFNSHTVVSESSKDNCEGDYVGFYESYDGQSHQDCPSIVSTQSEIAECLLNTQKSFEEENPECTTSMKIDKFLQNQKNVVSKITHCESAGVDCAEEKALGRSFSDYEIESEHVADYSEKKGNWTSVHNDDAFEVDSGDTNKNTGKANAVDIHSQQSDAYDDENMYDTVASSEVETYNSYTVVSESSKDRCEGDYVGFNESYDSHQNSPLIVSSQSEIAECLLNTQKSFEEENSKCAISMKIDNFPQNQKNVLSKITHCESAGVDCAEEDAWRHSFSDYEVEPESVADYSEKKENGTSVHNDDAFAIDSDKLPKSVDMSPIAPSNLPSSVDDIKYNCRVLLYDILAGKKQKAPSNLPSSVDDIKYNCRVLLYDIFAGKKRKNDQEEKVVYRHVKKRIAVSDEDEATKDSNSVEDDDPDYKSKGLSSYEKMIEEKKAERIAFMKSIEIYKIKEEISKARDSIKQLKKKRVKKKRYLPSFMPNRRSKRLPIVKVARKTKRKDNKKKTLKKSTKKTLISQKKKNMKKSRDVEEIILVSDEDESTEDLDDDPDYEGPVYRPVKKRIFVPDEHF